MGPIIAAALISAGAGVAGSMIGSRNAPESGEIRRHMPRYLDMNAKFFRQQQDFSWQKASNNAGIAGRWNKFYQDLANANSLSASRQQNMNWSRYGAPLFKNQSRVAAETQNRDWGQYGKSLFRDQAFTASRTANEQWGQFGKPLFQDQQRTIAQSELSNLQATSVGRGEAERAYLDAKFPGASTWDLLGSGGGAGGGPGAIPGAPGMPAPSPGSVSGRGVAGVDPRMVDAAALQAQSDLKGQYQSELVAQAAAQETQAAIVKAQMKNQMAIATQGSIAGIVQAAIASNESPKKIGKITAETKRAMAETENIQAAKQGIEATSTLKSVGGLVNEAGDAIGSGIDTAKKYGSEAMKWTEENAPRILEDMKQQYYQLQQRAAEMGAHINKGLNDLFRKHGSKSVRPMKKPGIQPRTIYIR